MFCTRRFNSRRGVIFCLYFFDLLLKEGLLKFFAVYKSTGRKAGKIRSKDRGNDQASSEVQLYSSRGFTHQLMFPSSGGCLSV